MNKLKTVLKHLWLDESDTRQAIPAAIRDQLAAQVAASEQRHSGEIRICIEAALPASYLWRLKGGTTLADLTRQRAVMVFGKLRVWDTEHNNGVLIYLLLAERAIEIVADRGVSRHVSAAQWQALVARMAASFQAGRYAEGLGQAIAENSAVLQQHFALDTAPGAPGNPDELPNNPVLL